MADDRLLLALIYTTHQSHMIGWARPMRGGERRDVVATNARESRLLGARSGLAALSVEAALGCSSLVVSGPEFPQV